MRIGFASDFHLGFGSGRRKGDARKQAERAMRELIKQGVDLIVLAGDLFDNPIPRPETLRDAAQVFKLAQKKQGVEIRCVGRDTPDVKGIPLLAIHGNHDRRVKGDVNPVQLMDLVGYLVYMHDTGVVAEEMGFWGVGSVPESYSQRLFASLKAKSLGTPSFFIFHQDLHPYVPHASLRLSDLPRGFSYYVNGHIHESQRKEQLLIVGSTVVTQMRKEEDKKYVWVWDKGFEKIEIPSRPLYYLEVDAKGRSPGEIIGEVETALEEIASKDHDETPMVRVKVIGKLAPGFKPADLMFTNTTDLIVGFHKRLEGSVLSEVDIGSLDLDDLAINTFKKVLEERKLDLDVSKLYALLLQGDEMGVWKMLEGRE